MGRATSNLGKSGEACIKLRKSSRHRPEEFVQLESKTTTTRANSFRKLKSECTAVRTGSISNKTVEKNTREILSSHTDNNRAAKD